MMGQKLGVTLEFCKVFLSDNPRSTTTAANFFS
jgi:hypothetical protein